MMRNGHLLIFESILTVGESHLLSEVDVKKPLMDGCLDALNDLEVLEDLVTTFCLEEVALC
jgi:hypothetical protein